MLWTALCPSLQTIPPGPWNEHRFKQIARDRSEENWRVVDTGGRYGGYTGVYQETLGGAGAQAFYPLGESNRRYVFSYDEGDSGWLLYEHKVGLKASVVWRVDLRAKDRWNLRKQIGSTVKGTLSRYLAYYGWFVANPSRLTPAEHDRLTGLRAFAVIAPSGDDPGHSPKGTFVRPDGNPRDSARDQVPGFTITPNEKAALAGIRSKLQRRMG